MLTGILLIMLLWCASNIAAQISIPITHFADVGKKALIDVGIGKQGDRSGFNLVWEKLENDLYSRFNSPSDSSKLLDPLQFIETMQSWTQSHFLPWIKSSTFTNNHLEQIEQRIKDLETRLWRYHHL